MKSYLLCAVNLWFDDVYVAMTRVRTLLAQIMHRHGSGDKCVDEMLGHGEVGVNCGHHVRVQVHAHVACEQKRLMGKRFS